MNSSLWTYVPQDQMYPPKKTLFSNNINNPMKIQDSRTTSTILQSGPRAKRTSIRPDPQSNLAISRENEPDELTREQDTRLRQEERLACD